MFGFRADGTRVKNSSLMFKIIPHIMRERDDSQVYFSQDVVIKGMDEYIDKKAKEGIKLSYMNIIYAAIVRTIKERPYLNRFIMDGRIFDRKGIFISLAIKKTMEDDGEQTVLKIPFSGEETIFEVKEKVDSII